MAINWKKAEKNPNKAQKIQCQYLLDLRSELEGLEKKIADAKNELENLKKSS